MKKTGLLAILAANVIILIFTGYMLYNYLGNDKTPPKIQPQTENKAPQQKEDEQNKDSMVPREGPAKVKIVSIPAEAKVFVKGYFKGRTPVKVTIVSVDGVEKMQFTLIKPGYKKWSRDLEVISGREKAYRVILEKN